MIQKSVGDRVVSGCGLSAALTLDPLLPRDPAAALSLELSPAFFPDPQARQTLTAALDRYASSLSGPAVTISVGVADLPGSDLGEGGPDGAGRGTVTFDSGTDWYFGLEPGAGAGQTDFYSVALHEIGHVLGLGTSPAWDSLLSDGTFLGTQADAVYGSPVPISADQAHWADNLTVNGVRALMDPTIPPATREGVSALDAAALADIGWGVNVAALVDPVPAPQTPFVGYLGPVRWVDADVTGDGITDHIALPATGSHVKVFDGASGNTVRSLIAFPGYDGVTSIGAADLNGDGAAELLLSAQVNGHVKVFDGKTNTLLLSALPAT